MTLEYVHSKFPWRRVPYRHGTGSEIRNDTRCIAIELEHKDAEFIIRACHCHGELLAACIEASESLQDDIEAANWADDAEDQRYPLLLKLREAIAKAEA